MKLKRTLLSSVAAVTLISGAAFAASTSNGTTVALDGTGDYLIFPVYAADNSGSWKTGIKVVNTNTTAAVVAKVVIREALSSDEKMDFPIYLSPGDVWTAEIRQDGDNVEIYSNDDSIEYAISSEVSDTTTWANATGKAFEYPFFAQEANQDNKYGYIEVFGLAQADATYILGTSFQEGTPLAKDKIRKSFLSKVHNTMTGDTNSTGWAGVTTDALAGEATIYAASGTDRKLAMVLPATAFEGVTGANEVFVKTIGEDTTYTTATNVAAEVGQIALIRQVEAALAKTHVYVPYNAKSATESAATKLILTQPTKFHRTQVTGLGLTSLDKDVDATAFWDLKTSTVTGYVYGTHDYFFEYSAQGRDESEVTVKYSGNEISGGPDSTNAKCYDESCWLNVAGFTGSLADASQPKGYVDFRPLNANGLAAVPVVMTGRSVDGTTVSNMLYPSYKARIHQVAPGTTPLAPGTTPLVP